jgi:hypothetical protein
MKNTFFILGLALAFIIQAKAHSVPLTSFEKIDQALARNTITAADAIGFKVLAFFHDQNLPVEFQGDTDALVTDAPDTLVAKASRLLPQMTRSLAVQVYWYMIPAPYRPEPNNKLNADFPIPSDIPQQEWTFIDDAASNIRVWFQKDQDDQRVIAGRIRTHLRDTIIDAQKRLMGRTHPKDDLGNHSILVALGIRRAIPNGGDGKLDIYLHVLPPEPNGARPPKAWVMGYDREATSSHSCPSRPSFMAFNLTWAKRVNDNKLKSTLAHEYFHVLQNSYDRRLECDEYDKIDEGTATYIKHYMYPQVNDEHDWYQFAQNGRLSLIDAAYESWPFYLFMAETHGTHSISTLYNNMNLYGAMESINKSLDGGFKKQWVEYSVYEWNQEPLQDGPRIWDNFTVIPGRGTPDNRGRLPKIDVEKVKLDQNGQYRFDMNMELKPLTRDFYAFDLSANGIRSVAIENPVMMNGRKVNVKALIRRKGQTSFDEVLWQENNRQEYHYCLDKQIEEIDYILLVVANYQHQPNASTYRANPSFKVTNQGCYGFKGKISSLWQRKTQEAEHRLEVNGSNITYLAGTHARDGVFSNQFYAKTGQISYSYKGRIGDCVGEATGQLDVELGPNAISMGLASYNVAPEAWGDYQVGLRLPQPFFNVTYICPPPGRSFTGSQTVILDTSWGANRTVHHRGSPVLEGKTTSQEWSFEWGFTPIRE